jgi:rod shape-determining protein MreC
MAVLEIRQRTGWLFGVVVVAHLILISAQARPGGGVPPLTSFVFGAFAEVQRVSTAAVGAIQRTWQDYFALQEVQRDNDALRAQISELRVTLQEQQGVAGESRALQELLGLKRELPLATAASRVIGGGASPTFRTITIDKGSGDGVLSDMAVIAPTGVVGRIVQPSARSSKVQLLIDASAAAGPIVERSRAQGVVEGYREGRHEGLRLRYVSGTADIQKGDRVVTSGIEGIFPSSIDGRYPRGFVIGHIESFEKRGGQYENVVVRPAVDFSSLETVLVVLAPPPAGADRTAAGSKAAVGSNAAEGKGVATAATEAR